MTIEEKTVYVTKGKTFNSLHDATIYREDLIGEFFDKALPGAEISPGARIRLTEYCASNREMLSDLLRY